LSAQGHGVTQDYSQAGEWYRKAADQGNLRGREGLAKYKLDCVRTGSHGEYTKLDFIRDTKVISGTSFAWMIGTMSLMNCGRPLSARNIGDFMCDPTFKRMSLTETRSMARTFWRTKCGHLLINASPSQSTSSAGLSERPRPATEPSRALSRELPRPAIPQTQPITTGSISPDRSSSKTLGQYDLSATMGQSLPK
jgi:TPR repeat protein